MKNKQVEYASFWSRVGANALDQIIIGIPVFVLLGQVIPYLVDFDSIEASPNKETKLLIEFLKNLIFVEIIAVGMWSAVMAFFITSAWQASPGKRIMGLYIIRSDGGKPTAVQTFLRFASLPLLILLAQIFERDEIYSKLEELDKSGKELKTIEELFAFLSDSQNAAYSDLAAMLIGGFWLLLIVFTKQKTAGHDILFETRVVRGKL